MSAPHLTQERLHAFAADARAGLDAVSDAQTATVAVPMLELVAVLEELIELRRLVGYVSRPPADGR